MNGNKSVYSLGQTKKTKNPLYYSPGHLNKLGNTNNPLLEKSDHSLLPTDLHLPTPPLHAPLIEWHVSQSIWTIALLTHKVTRGKLGI